MALTATKALLTVMGDRIFGSYKITGDGATTTWNAPLATIDGAWYQRGDDTETDEKLTWSGNTITWSTAIANGKYGYIFFVGV